MQIKPGIPSLTGIRGVAAILVVLHHIQGEAPSFGFPAWKGNYLLRDGFRGVDLFFMLSGFVLMYVHTNDFKAITLDGLRRFYILRFFRVYPLNAFVLLLILLPVVFLPGFLAWSRMYDPTAFSPAGFVQTLLLANRWFMRDLGAWNERTWSLSLEILGYAAFPLLAWWICRESSRIRCAIYAIALIAALVVVQVAMGVANENAIGRSGLFRVFTCLPAGMAICRILDLSSPEERWAPRLATWSTILLMACLATPYTRVLAPFCFGGIILGVAFRRGAVNRFLASRPILFLGTVSFPLYLVHYIVLSIVFWLHGTGQLVTTPGVLVAILIGYLVACLGLSYALHIWIELPSRLLCRRLLGRRPTAPAIATSV